MTREELKEHCKKQIENCEMWATYKGEEPHGKVYEEHKLILELLEQETVSKESYDHEYFLRKELEIKIAKLEQDKNKVLDKIRAEIQALSPEPTAYDVIDGNPVKDAVWETIADVLKIIDKYKVESESQESDIEKRKSCINYEDGCEEWAGCPCVYYKAESGENE